MAEQNSDPIQPEPLDRQAFTRMLNTYSDIVLSEHSRDVNTAQAGFIWPGTEMKNRDSSFGPLPAVARMRQFHVSSGSVRARVELYMLNEAAASVTSLPDENLRKAEMAKKGTEIGTMMVVTTDGRTKDSEPGDLILALKIFAGGHIDVATLEAVKPEAQVERHENLLKVVSYLGISTEMATTETLMVADAVFNDEDLALLTEGFERLKASEAPDIQLD